MPIAAFSRPESKHLVFGFDFGFALLGAGDDLLDNRSTDANQRRGVFRANIRHLSTRNRKDYHSSKTVMSGASRARNFLFWETFRLPGLFRPGLLPRPKRMRAGQAVPFLSPFFRS